MIPFLNDLVRVPASLPPTHGGSFNPVKRITLELPTRALSPQRDLRSRRNMYLTSSFCQRVLPGLIHRPEIAPLKKDEPPIPPTVTLVFWRSNKPLTSEDLARRFTGKEHHVPWVSLQPLFEWYDHWVDERPFSMDANGIIFFTEHKDQAEKKIVSPIHAFGKYASLHSQWWVDLFGQGDGKAKCPPEAVFVSTEAA